jgi:hypothetical protein
VVSFSGSSNISIYSGNTARYARTQNVEQTNPVHFGYDGGFSGFFNEMGRYLAKHPLDTINFNQQKALVQGQSKKLVGGDFWYGIGDFDSSITPMVTYRQSGDWHQMAFVLFKTKTKVKPVSPDGWSRIRVESQPRSDGWESIVLSWQGNADLLQKACQNRELRYHDAPNIFISEGNKGSEGLGQLTEAFDPFGLPIESREKASIIDVTSGEIEYEEARARFFTAKYILEQPSVPMTLPRSMR